MLYTRKGDNGTSGLFGTKERLPKDSALFEALGALDELNAHAGLCRALASARLDCADIVEALLSLQQKLFIVQAELAGAGKSLVPRDVSDLEQVIDGIEHRLPARQGFVLPGASLLSASLHVARTVARRAERALIRASDLRNISESTRAYLNRASSLLYALSRLAAVREGAAEIAPTY